MKQYIINNITYTYESNSGNNYPHKIIYANTYEDIGSAIDYKFRLKDDIPILPYYLKAPLSEIIINDIIYLVDQEFLTKLQSCPKYLDPSYWNEIRCKPQYISKYISETYNVENVNYETYDNIFQIIVDMRYWENKTTEMLTLLNYKKTTYEDKLNNKRKLIIADYKMNLITKDTFVSMMVNAEKKYSMMKQKELIYDHYFLEKDNLDFYNERDKLARAQYEWEEDNREYERQKMLRC